MPEAALGCRTASRRDAAENYGAERGPRASRAPSSITPPLPSRLLPRHQCGPLLPHLSPLPTPLPPGKEQQMCTRSRNGVKDVEMQLMATPWPDGGLPQRLLRGPSSAGVNIGRSGGCGCSRTTSAGPRGRVPARTSAPGPASHPQPGRRGALRGPEAGNPPPGPAPLSNTTRRAAGGVGPVGGEGEERPETPRRHLKKK